MPKKVTVRFQDKPDPLVIEVVYRTIKHKRFRGKDAMKRAKVYVNKIKKIKSTDDIMPYNIYNGDGTNGYWDVEDKWRWVEMDG